MDKAICNTVGSKSDGAGAPEPEYALVVPSGLTEENSIRLPHIQLEADENKVCPLNDSNTPTMWAHLL